jgi:hypothetical protein
LFENDAVDTGNAVIAGVSRENIVDILVNTMPIEFNIHVNEFLRKETRAFYNIPYTFLIQDGEIRAILIISIS